MLLGLNTTALNSSQSVQKITYPPLTSIEETMQGIIRTIGSEINIDWNNDGVYSDETYYLLDIVIERSFNEPLGGISMAQCDIRLLNVKDRYTPNTLVRQQQDEEEIVSPSNAILLKNLIEFTTKNNIIIVQKGSL